MKRAPVTLPQHDIPALLQTSDGVSCSTHICCRQKTDQQRKQINTPNHAFYFNLCLKFNRSRCLKFSRSLLTVSAGQNNHNTSITHLVSRNYVHTHPNTTDIYFADVACKIWINRICVTKNKQLYCKHGAVQWFLQRFFMDFGTKKHQKLKHQRPIWRTDRF